MGHEISAQLPASFGVRIGQRVVATRDLMFGDAVGVRHGVCGVVASRFGDDRVTVNFDERVDGTVTGVNVTPSEIQPWRPLPGGFRFDQRVAASMDLCVEETLIVRAGTPGVVMGLYSDTRLTVKFVERADGLTHAVNVTAPEIVAL